MRAFTLLETLFAAALLCIVFFVVLSMYPTSIATQRKARDVVSATDLAARQLESCRSVPFDRLSVGTTELDTVTVNGTPFKPTLEVVQVSDLLKKVKIRVTWDSWGGGAGAAQSVELETQVYHFTNS